MMQLEKIFRQYYKPLVYFLSNKVNTQDAEDIAMSAILKCYDKPDGNMKSFLFTTAHNLVIDLYRKKIAHEKDHKDILFLSGEIEVQTEIVEAIVLERIYSAIRSLATQPKRVIEMFLEGKELKDIAVALNIKHRTAINQYARGIALIKKSLAGISNKCGRRKLTNLQRYESLIRNSVKRVQSKKAANNSMPAAPIPFNTFLKM